MRYLIPEPVPPRTTKPNLFSTFDLQIDALLGVPRAREAFRVDGTGLAAAVLDTGLRVTHRCFTGRVLEGRNFTGVGGADDVSDANGHGTNVAGLIAAGTSDERRGIAPGAKVVPLKVLPAETIEPIVAALNWVLKNSGRLGISVVNMSLGVPGVNLIDDVDARAEHPQLHQVLARLHSENIAVCVAAGNDYFRFQQEGMSIPAIFREAIAVGAVYDSSVGSRFYDGAVAMMTRADQITPFSQRLSKEASPECYTDVFSAGGGATSAGALSDDDTSTQDGTSQAAPTVAGVVLLLQQHYLRLTNKLPPVGLLQDVLRSTSRWLVDSEEDQDDNVVNTGRRFPRISAFESLVAIDRHVKLHA